MAPRRRRGEVPDGIAPALATGPAYLALERRMRAARDEAGPKPTADGTPLRSSMAGDCTRKIAFQVLGVEPAIELSTETLITFDVGNSYHEVIQEALAAELGAQLEVVASHKTTYAVSGSADAVYDQPKTVVEIKSMKAFAWDLAVNGNDYDYVGPGPKKEHITQAAMYALAPEIDAQYLHMIYVNKDTGEIAEWVLGLHQPLFHLGGMDTAASLGKAELIRLKQVLLDLEGGTFPARDIPGFGVVRVRPPAADSKDKPWNCRYCGWQPICAKQQADEFPLSLTPWTIQRKETA
jgi:hypothetical protein